MKISSMSKEVILGISYSHNSSACLMDMDGNLIFASSEERFTKNKNDLGIPKETINYILNNFLNLQITAICVGDKLDMQCSTADYLNYFYFENYKKRNFIFLKKKFFFIFVILKEIIFRLIKKKVSAKNVFKINLKSLGLTSKVYYFDHHYSHACSAYYSNNFNGGHVLTMDGEGNGISGSFWKVKKDKLKKICTFDRKSSLGISYRTITSFLNFKPNEHEGKVTGLSSYSLKNNNILNFFNSKIFFQKNNNKIINKISEKYFLSFGSSNNRSIISLMNTFLSIFKCNNYKDFYTAVLFFSAKKILLKMGLAHEDTINFKKKISYAIQFVTEKTILSFLNNNLKNKTNLYLAGGLFANVKLNSEILKNKFINNLYIFPAMGDEGLSVGACYAYLIKFKKTIIKKEFNPYLGYKVKKISKYLDFKKLDINIHKKTDFLAKSLFQDKIIGIVFGKSEFGPRALGHRSIIACPKNKKVNEYLNKRLGRYEYMPFAPVTIKKNFYKVFNPINKKNLVNNKYMTLVNQIRNNNLNIDGVIHVDNSARPQILDKSSNPLLYKLLAHYYKTYKIPCLINTSFNDHGLPIINDENDALEALRKSRVDILLIEDDIVVNK